MLSHFLMEREPTALYLDLLDLNIVRMWAKVSGIPTYIIHGLSGSVSGQGRFPRKEPCTFSISAPPPHPHPPSTRLRSHPAPSKRTAAHPACVRCQFPTGILSLTIAGEEWSPYPHAICWTQRKAEFQESTYTFCWSPHPARFSQEQEEEEERSLIIDLISFPSLQVPLLSFRSLEVLLLSLLSLLRNPRPCHSRLVCVEGWHVVGHDGGVRRSR